MSDQLLARARLTATRKWPHATAAILSLVPVEKPGLGTCAVDRWWRLYWDKDFLSKCSADEAAGVILHEVSHCLLKHADRAQAIVAKNDEALFRLWNIAADAAINHTLQQEKIALPKGVIYPATLKLDGNQSAEWYFAKLKERIREEQGKQSLQGKPICGGLRGPGGGDGEAGQDPPDGSSNWPPSAGGTAVQPQDPGTSGSCSDGRQRPWEDGPPVSEEEAAQQEASGQTPPPPGLAPHEQQQIQQQVAEAMKSRGTMRGNVWAGFVEEVLNPKVDPRTLLMRAVRHAVEQVSGGCDDWTWRRPARRQGLGGMLRPSPVQIVPRVTLIVDSSGSMGREDLGLAVGLIAKVLSGLRLRDGVHVIVGDTDVQSVGKVFDPKKVAIVGRGGTSMARLIEYAAEQKPEPDVIVVATDGETDYPVKPVKPKVVIALTRKSCYCPPPPAWMQTVDMSRK